MGNLKYIGYSIVFQEVPNEISLTLNVSGCPYRCSGCHSKFLWEDEGMPIKASLPSLLKEYKGRITTVCFMGGDHNLIELAELLKMVREDGLKTCLYSGADDINKFNGILDVLDFLKVGHYEEALGGLDSETTNQRFYKIQHHPITLIDQTENFRRHYE